MMRITRWGTEKDGSMWKEYQGERKGKKTMHVHQWSPPFHSFLLFRPSWYRTSGMPIEVSPPACPLMWYWSPVKILWSLFCHCCPDQMFGTHVHRTCLRFPRGRSLSTPPGIYFLSTVLTGSLSVMIKQCWLNRYLTRHRIMIIH